LLSKRPSAASSAKGHPAFPTARSRSSRFLKKLLKDFVADQSSQRQELSPGSLWTRLPSRRTVRENLYLPQEGGTDCYRPH
jgi:hypothetical protein